MARVTMRYWAAARQAAGVEEEQVDAADVAGALAAARMLRTDLPPFDRVLKASSLLVSGDPVGTRDPAAVRLTDGDVVEVLPPFAGG